MAEKDPCMEANDHVFWGEISPSIVAASAEQDDHLEQLRQGKIYAGGDSPLQKNDSSLARLRQKG